MKLADVSVERPVAISMLIVAIIFLGLFSLPRLAVDLYPDMKIPVAIISTSYEGAAPAEVEKLITKPIEAAVGTVNNIKEIQSISQNGNSLVIVQFNWGANIDNCVNDVRDKVDFIRGMLPSDASTPMVMKIDPNAMPIITYSLSGADLVKLKKIAEDTVQPNLERVDGVSSVYISGGKQREIQVRLNEAKVESYGLSVPLIMQAISGDNVSGTAGTVVQGSQEIYIKLNNEYSSVDAIKGIKISLPGTPGNYVTLSDIADVRDSFAKDTNLTFVNGQPSLSLSIMKASDGNTVQVAKGVHKEVEALKGLLPPGVKINTVLDSSTFIQDAINNVVYHGFIGVIFAVIILYLFLRSMRSTLVIALAIPIALIATFMIMYFTGQTINMLSLGGLMLGIGSLVDFSIVVLESIFRHRQGGLDAAQAAKVGTAEVGTAVMASAASQIVVFLPIVFVSGLASILFSPLALTVSFSHAAALFAALTLVPMMASKLLKDLAPMEEIQYRKGTKNPLSLFGYFLQRLNARYRRILAWALVHRKRVVIVTAIMLVASLALIPTLGAEFIPNMDQREMTVNLKMPTGTKLDDTRRMASDLEGLINHELSGGIENVFTTVGAGNMAFLGVSNSESASIQIKLKPLEQYKLSTEEAAEKLRRLVANVPGADIKISTTDNEASGPSSTAVQVIIRGNDLEVLKGLGDMVANAVKEVPGTRNVANSLSDTRTEMQVVVDRDKAAYYGLSASQVLSAIRTSFDGTVVGKMRTGEDEVDIRLMYPNDSGKNPIDLNNLTIVSSTGAKVPVSEVATVQAQDAPQTINRSMQNREVSITADVAGRSSGAVNKDIQTKLSKMSLPQGYSIEFGGQAKDMAESFSSLGVALLLSILLTFMVMAAQFESLFQPFIIMFSLPPTVIGVVLGLFITRHPISVPALIGMIMLVGIVLNNAIVLVDYINTLRKRGYERNQAVLEAGPIRLRPILMTALCTVLAILPLAFGKGQGSEAQAPMAIVIAFGLTLSTLVTLVLVPVVYTIFDDLGKKKWFSWLHASPFKRFQKKPVTT